MQADKAETVRYGFIGTICWNPLSKGLKVLSYIYSPRCNLQRSEQRNQYFLLSVGVTLAA